MTHAAAHGLIAAVNSVAPVIAYLGLGSNLGDRRAFLAAARDALAATPGVTLRACSSLYASPPQGGPPGQGEYLNAVLAIVTILDAETLLFRCQAIEATHGRERSIRWGARTLDIDLLSYGECRRDDATLTLPHPRLAERLFVLRPWCELAPELHPPGSERSVHELLTALGNGDCRRLDTPW